MQDSAAAPKTTGLESATGACAYSDANRSACSHADIHLAAPRGSCVSKSWNISTNYAKSDTENQKLPGRLERSRTSELDSNFPEKDIGVGSACLSIIAHKSEQFRSAPAFCFWDCLMMVGLLAPQVGLEPTTLRLTAECSTIELLRSKMARAIS